MSELRHLIDASIHGDLEEVRVILQSNPEFINQKDSTGATALHYAAFGGHRSVVECLVHYGANINATDAKFNATPAGWAIEYLREMGALLAIELADFEHAIQRGDAEWAARFLKRFPALRGAVNAQGTPFRDLAAQSGNPEIVRLFDSDPSR